MSRFLKGLVGVAVALALAGAPLAAAAAPPRTASPEAGIVAALDAAWTRLVSAWSGLVGTDEHSQILISTGLVACSDTSCSPPNGAAGDPDATGGTTQETDAGPSVGSDG